MPLACTLKVARVLDRRQRRRSIPAHVSHTDYDNDYDYDYDQEARA